MHVRSRLRNRLIRWLGGEPKGPEPLSYVQARNPAVIPEQGSLVLRSADSAGQALLAGRYFAHAEDLIQRGAADLAAPLYRQAYELLQAGLLLVQDQLDSLGCGNGLDLLQSPYETARRRLGYRP